MTHYENNNTIYIPSHFILAFVIGFVDEFIVHSFCNCIYILYKIRNNKPIVNLLTCQMMEQHEMKQHLYIII